MSSLGAGAQIVRMHGQALDQLLVAVQRHEQLRSRNPAAAWKSWRIFIKKFRGFANRLKINDFELFSETKLSGSKTDYPKSAQRDATEEDGEGKDGQINKKRKNLLNFQFLCIILPLPSNTHLRICPPPLPIWFLNMTLSSPHERQFLDPTSWNSL